MGAITKPGRIQWIVTGNGPTIKTSTRMRRYADWRRGTGKKPAEELPEETSPYRHKTIAKAKREVEEQLAAAPTTTIEIVAGLRIATKADYKKTLEQLEVLKGWITLGSEEKIPDRLKQEYELASSKEEYMKQLSGAYYWSIQTEESASTAFPNTVLKFCTELIDTQDKGARQIARDLLLGRLAAAPQEIRTFILDTWALSVNFDQIIEAFDQETPGKLAKITTPFTIDELKTLALLPYEVAYIKIGEEYFLLRGHERKVDLPSGCQVIFHNHPSDRPEAALPSWGIGSEDYSFDPKNGEYGFIISPHGILLYSGDCLSADSLEVFEKIILSHLKQGALAVAGRLLFHAYYETHSLPLGLISWEFLEQIKDSVSAPDWHRLLTAQGSSGEDSLVSMDGFPLARLLPAQTFRVIEQEGPIVYRDPQIPDDAWSTGECKVVAVYRKKKS
ncbi:MAG: hypothetical protein HQ596_03085 [Candidatus Saganbacteria bacterium]|nr:hypothetical protein [Candidatus Saganbacteria bacterium]